MKQESNNIKGFKRTFRNLK